MTKIITLAMLAAIFVVVVKREDWLPTPPARHSAEVEIQSADGGTALDVSRDETRVQDLCASLEDDGTE